MPTVSNSQRVLSRGVPRRFENLASEAAVRVMSETAHDLRAPLTTIQESVRLVRDGDLGDVTPGQTICLDSAIDQCHCMEQMINDMVQVERLRTGTPRVQRQWVSVQTVRKSIDETLRPWVMPRDIDVLWDGGEDPKLRVFADPAMLRRLIVNLVTNALRVTPQSGQILIRLQEIDSLFLQWSVVDMGRGLTQRELESIADRQVSFGGGEGLGLSICRQLAALHFSKLTIQSRLGSGTEVSFQTAAAGPRSVGELWSQWRIGQLPAEREASPVRSKGIGSNLAGDSERKVRLDSPCCRVELDHEAVRPRSECEFAAGGVSVGAMVNREAADRFDKFLQGQCYLFDFVYRIDVRRWVWVIDAEQETIQERIASIASAAVAASSQLRIDWSDPQMIPVNSKRSANRLTDLLVRETLFFATSDQVMDTNAVCLGTKPSQPSSVAAERLDEELVHLISKMKSQAGDFRQQAKRLSYLRAGKS